MQVFQIFFLYGILCTLPRRLSPLGGGWRSDVGPPQSLDLVPLHRVLDAHVIAHAVGVREGLGAALHRAGWRVPWVVLLQVSPHPGNVLDHSAAQGALEASGASAAAAAASGLLLLIATGLSMMMVVMVGLLVRLLLMVA